MEKILRIKENQKKTKALNKQNCDVLLETRKYWTFPKEIWISNGYCHTFFKYSYRQTKKYRTKCRRPNVTSGLPPQKKAGVTKTKPK